MIVTPVFAATAEVLTAKVALEAILAAQSVDGSYRDEQSGGAEKPFMSGITNDALILYYLLVEPDPRIVTAVRRSVDYNWANTWLGSSHAYYEWAFTHPSDPNWAGTRSPAPDLNMLVVNGYGWLATVTGESVYRERGRAVFKGGAELAYLDSPKHLNQTGLGYRALDDLD